MQIFFNRYFTAKFFGWNFSVLLFERIFSRVDCFWPVFIGQVFKHIFFERIVFCEFLLADFLERSFGRVFFRKIFWADFF